MLPKVQNKNFTLSLWNPVSFRYVHCTHTPFLLTHSLFVWRMRGAIKKTPSLTPLVETDSRFEFRKAVPAVSQEKENLPSRFQHTRLHQKIAIKFLSHTDHHQYDDNVCVPIFIRDNFHSKKYVHCPLLKAPSFTSVVRFSPSLHVFFFHYSRSLTLLLIIGGSFAHSPKKYHCLLSSAKKKGNFPTSGLRARLEFPHPVGFPAGYRPN